MKLLDWIKENKWKFALGSGGILLAGYFLKEFIEAEVIEEENKKNKLDNYE
jgi:hypothetical protein